MLYTSLRAIDYILVQIKFIPHRLERVDMVQVILIPQPEWVDMVKARNYTVSIS